MFLWDSYLKIFLLSFVSICDCYQTFYFPPMCDFESKTTDCSFQFQSALADNCLVYNTDACKKYSFSSWNLAPSSRLVSEIDSEFNVAILPYTAYDHGIQRSNKKFVSAINITLTSKSKDIKGFSIVMTEDIQKRNICRVIDFRKSAVSMEIPFVFFYDCFHQLVEDLWENVSITFKAYPLNTELNYFVYIPPLPVEESTSVCDWKPLVMVFRGSLSKCNIHFKFSNAPENFNITFFNVMLVDSLGVQVLQKRLYHNKSLMISGEFLDVTSGYYSVHIALLLAEKFCTVSETSYFFVGEKTKDYSTALLIALFILLVISASLLIYFSGQWYIRKASPKSKATLLFAYFHKSLLHNVLVGYSKHLEIHYGVKANMIYARSGNPLTYLREKVAQSDVIVFVLCQNLNALDRDSVGKGDHHWVNQLSEAISLIEDADVGSKRMCNVHFSESRASKCMKLKGPLFLLPKDLDRFLCFAFKCPSVLYVLSKLFREDHHKVSKHSVKIELDEELKRNLKVLMDAERGQSPLSKSQSESEPFMESERVERIKIDTSSKIYEPPVSDNLLKECEQENLVLKKKEENSDDLRNDPMKFCVRKLFFSE